MFVFAEEHAVLEGILSGRPRGPESCTGAGLPLEGDGCTHLHPFSRNDEKLQRLECSWWVQPDPESVLLIIQESGICSKMSIQADSLILEPKETVCGKAAAYGPKQKRTKASNDSWKVCFLFWVVVFFFNPFQRLTSFLKNSVPDNWMKGVPLLWCTESKLFKSFLMTLAGINAWMKMSDCCSLNFVLFRCVSFFKKILRDQSYFKVKVRQITFCGIVPPPLYNSLRIIWILVW